MDETIITRNSSSQAAFLCMHCFLTKCASLQLCRTDLIQGKVYQADIISHICMHTHQHPHQHPHACTHKQTQTARGRDRFCDENNLRDQLCFCGIRAYMAISSHLIKHYTPMDKCYAQSLMSHRYICWQRKVFPNPQSRYPIYTSSLHTVPSTSLDSQHTACTATTHYLGLL